MRGTVAKRERKLGLRSGRVERAVPVGAELAAIEMRQDAARAPYVNARRSRDAEDEA